jgi:hypothetical protein
MLMLSIVLVQLAGSGITSGAPAHRDTLSLSVEVSIPAPQL